MKINYDLKKLRKLIENEFESSGIALDKSSIENDQYEFNVNLSLKGYEGSILYHGIVEKDGYATFEAVFDEIEVSKESLVCINEFNDLADCVKACISLRGDENNNINFLVFSRDEQFIPDEESMVQCAVQLINFVSDADNKDIIDPLIKFVVKKNDKKLN